MEIHEVLSPASGRQGGSVQPQQTPPTAKTQPKPESFSLRDLSCLIKDSVVSGVQEGLNFNSLDNICKSLENSNKNLNRFISNNVENEKVSFKRPRLSSQNDNDLPRVGSDAVEEDTAPPVEVFGANINDIEEEETESSEDEEEESIPAPSIFNSRNPPHTHAKNTVKNLAPTSIASSSAIAGDVPDADLPSVDPRPPAIWNPKIKVMKWVNDAVENEWSLEDRKKIVEKFHPEEKFDHLLTPVKMPKKLYKAIKTPSVKQKDYLFNRLNAEKDLFNASSDLCASLRPLIEAVSLLDDKDGCGDIKNLIGVGMMGIFSANKKISKGRREIGRKCVRLDCSDALYGVPPSHYSLFGGVSDAEAAKSAKDTTKADDTLVFAPKPKKFRPSYSTQGFQKFSGKAFNTPYNYNNNSNYKGKAWWYYQNQNQNQPSRGRGRGRGGKGYQKKQPAKTSTSKE